MKRVYGDANVTPFGYQTSEAMDHNKLEFSRTSVKEDRKGTWCQPKEELVSWKEISHSSDICQDRGLSSGDGQVRIAVRTFCPLLKHEPLSGHSI